MSRATGKSGDDDKIGNSAFKPWRQKFRLPILKRKVKNQKTSPPQNQKEILPSTSLATDQLEFGNALALNAARIDGIGTEASEGAMTIQSTVTSPKEPPEVENRQEVRLVLT